MPDVYLALGSNLGDRLRHLRDAVRQLARLPETQLVEASPVYESEAVTNGDKDAPDYLNAVIHVQTRLEPLDLLRSCHNIEGLAGRVRDGRRWESRTLDIDILVYGTQSFESDALTVPHPRMRGRIFVLQPLFDLAPDLHLPAPYDASVRYLLGQCEDQDALRRTSHVLHTEPPSTPTL